MGDIVRSAREVKHLTQSALAGKIGVTKQTIIAIEKNRRHPTFEDFCRLVLTLDLSANQIIYSHRVSYTSEHAQLFRELMACDERGQRIALSTLRALLRALQHDEPEKQG